MKIQKIEEKDRKILLRLSGDLVISEAKEAKRELEKFCKEANVIILDLAEISEFDTAGLQLILALKLYLSEQGKKLKLINHPLSVIKYLDLFGLIAFFGDKIKVSRDIRPQLLLSYSLKKD